MMLLLLTNRQVRGQSTLAEKQLWLLTLHPPACQALRAERKSSAEMSRSGEGTELKY